MLLQLLLPLVQAEVFQFSTQIETTALESSDQIEQVTASVASSPLGARLPCCLRQPLALTETFSWASVLLKIPVPPPHAHLASHPVNDALIWPQAPPSVLVV